jgi:hypothetical protein
LKSRPDLAAGAKAEQGMILLAKKVIKHEGTFLSLKTIIYKPFHDKSGQAIANKG